MKILKIKTERRKTGDFGERAAVRFLRRSGYRILKRNYVAADSEIDVICTKGDFLVFVEVKTRNVENLSPMEPRPASAVTEEKMRKIMHAAAFYKGYNPVDKKMRFDIIEVFLEGSVKLKVKEIKHLIGAFTKDNLKKRQRGF